MTEKLLEELKPYMLTNEYVFEKKESLDTTFLQNKIFYRVNEKDSLFWTLFILIRGFEAYESLIATSFLSEKEEKFRYLDILKDPYSKVLLKEKNIKNLKNVVENNLSNDETISVKTFITLAILNKIDFLFVEKNKIFKNGMLSNQVGDNTKLRIVRYDPERRVCTIDMHFSVEETNKLLTTYFPWESIDNPFKSISYYTYDELLEIATKIGYEATDKKQTKKQLYKYIESRVK
jgi:hypothetical protein